MNKDELIREILNTVTGKTMSFEGVPVSMWITAAQNPTDEKWLEYCRNAVSVFESTAGRRDTDSVFAKCLRLAEERRHDEEA